MLGKRNTNVGSLSLGVLTARQFRRNPLPGLICVVARFQEVHIWIFCDTDQMGLQNSWLMVPRLTGSLFLVDEKTIQYLITFQCPEEFGDKTTCGLERQKLTF
jgi:hypothetical protein